MNKEDVRNILISMRTADNEATVNFLLGNIDMKDDENKAKIEELLKEQLKNDRAKTQVEGFTKLDLMEMSQILANQLKLVTLLSLT